MIDPLATRQVIDGFGASSRVWDDPHLLGGASRQVPSDARRVVLEALFDDLGLTRLRPVLDRGVEPVNDNADPLTADPRVFTFAGKLGDSHVEVVSQAVDAGLSSFFPAPLTLETWMNDGNPEEYVEWAMMMLRRWRELGFPPPWYSPVNEPAHPRAGRLSPAWFTDVVKLLGRRLREEGFATKLVIPDDLNPTQAYRRASAVLADADARPFVGAIAYHDYRGGIDEDKVRLRELARASGIPVWMTEFSNPSLDAWPAAVDWASRIHDALDKGGASAVDFMWAFSGGEPSTLVNLDFDGNRYLGHRLTPTYHITGQFSRFVSPGSTRVEVDSASGEVQVSAFRRVDGRLVVVAVNRATTAQEVVVSLKSGTLSGPLDATRTTQTENGAALAAVVPDGSEFAVSLSPVSVTTLVGPLAA